MDNEITCSYAIDSYHNKPTLKGHNKLYQYDYNVQLCKIMTWTYCNP